MSASRTNESTTAARPSCEISEARNSKKPSSSSASRRRAGRERGRIGVLGSLDRAHLNLELPAEALDAAEHAHGVTFAEALVEQIDVVPDARFDAAARVHELEREVGGARASAPALLSCHREHALDGPVLDELGDRGHVSTIWREPIGTLAAMADIQPFRAVRYAGAAGALADLVAPPYDAVDDEERAALYTRSPYNVVHVTLPESADEAGRLYREWLAEGVLEQDDEPAVWLAVEEFVGPDGVARERRGVIVSVAADALRGRRACFRTSARIHASARNAGVSSTRRESSRSRSSCWPTRPWRSPSRRSPRTSRSTARACGASC